MTNPTPPCIGFRRLDVEAAESWIAQALKLKLFATNEINAWCDDETRSGQTGLLIDDRFQASDVAGLLKRWPRGRLFTEQADLRWEQLTATEIHVVVIAARQHLDNLGMEGILELEAEGAPRTLLLWGKREGNAWREERIPDLPGYMPTSWQGEYAGLTVQHYRAEWPDRREAFCGERRIVRYLGYDGGYNPPADPRFEQPNPNRATP